MAPPHVVVALDRPGWCFHRIALKLVEYLSDEFSFRVAPHVSITHGDCDVLLNLWWGHTLRLKACLNARSVVTCIYDCLSWNVDDGARHHFDLVLRHTDLLLVCNEELAERIRKEHPDGPPVMLCEDGVDPELFRLQPWPKGEKPELGWTGNSQRMTPGGPEDQKGVEFLKAMARQAGVGLSLLDAQHGGAWPHSDMPKFYRDISWYACASFREGTPNPVLEAMACGRPVISTPVGLVPKLIRHGENGFIAERSPEVWRELLGRIKRMPLEEAERMGLQARKAVERRWAWGAKVEQFRMAFRTAIKQANRPRKLPADPVPRVPARLEKVIPPSAAERAARRPHRKHDPTTVLLISDVPGWAFDQNMQDLALHLQGKFKFSHWYVIDFIQQHDMPDLDEHDVVFCVYHRWPIMNLLPMERTVGSLRARWLWPERPGKPSAEDVTFVNGFRAFHVVTRESYDELRALCPGVVYLTNPVNMDRFPTAENPGRVVASWNGNARHGNKANPDVKGFSSVVKPACQLAGVELVYAEYNTCRLPPSEMPRFYKRGSVALCASSYEGASNSIMEGMAAGQAVISTPVGNIVEIRESQLKHLGDTGIVLAERTPEAFAAALRGMADKPERMVEMGQLNRKEIAARWSWKVWAERYEEFLRMAL